MGSKPISPILSQAEKATAESKYIDFKERFDPDSSRDWIELTKDIVAMANTGGGAIVFGVSNDGSNSGFNVEKVLRVDPANVTNKIAAYTGRQFSDFEMHESRRAGQRVAVLEIRGTSVPMVFVRPGAYEALSRKRPKIAFRKGTVYFRHGAKSEPGDSDDLREVIEREFRRNRQTLMKNLRKVMEAPAGSNIQVSPSGEPGVSPLTVIRVTDDPDAPAVPGAHPDQTHPYRMKDLVRILNEKLGPRTPLNAFDLISVRRVHNIEGQRQYFYKPLYSSPQYTDAFIDWVIARYRANPRFFREARAEWKKQQIGSRGLPLEGYNNDTE